jgi:hypothetical protein
MLPFVTLRAELWDCAGELTMADKMQKGPSKTQPKTKKALKEKRAVKKTAS